MGTILRVILLVIAVLFIGVDGIAQPYYYLLPGTGSHRQDADGDDINVNFIYRGTYLGAPEGISANTGYNSGAFTSSGRTNGYKDLVLFQYSTAYGIQGTDSFNVTPTSSKYFRQNMRLATPHAYKADVQNGTVGDTQYPLLLFMHGGGERGTGCFGGTNDNSCFDVDEPQYLNNDRNLLHGGDDFLRAMNRDQNLQNSWPGFVLVPQNEHGWEQNSLPFVPIAIKKLLEQYPIDPNRIYVTGLSDGGNATWRLLYENPELFAAAAPISGTTVRGYDEKGPVFPAEAIAEIPIWQFQGSEDNNPPAERSENNLNRLRNVGATPRYTKYINFGHSIWDKAWNEPDYYSWLLQYSKLTIHSFYGSDYICEGSSQKLGISDGFAEYEWQKSLDVDNPSWTSMSAISGQPNAIAATEAGLYRVRFRRVTTGWTEWSEPFELELRPRPKPEIYATGSWELWGLDNNETLTLYTLDEGTNYQWYRNGVPYLGGPTQTSILLNEQADHNVYSLEYTDQFRCPSVRSEPIYATTAPFNGGPVPATPTNLSGQSSGDGKITIWWDDNAEDELGYEIYHSLNGTDYTWLANIAPNSISYEDTELPGESVFYRIRAFNQYGPSGEPGPLEVILPEDLNPPAAPQNFSFLRFNIVENRINAENKVVREVPVTIYDEYFNIELNKAIFSWDPVDEDGDVFYDFYNQNGTLLATTQDTSYMVTGLPENSNFSYFVKARDISGRSSQPSQTGHVFTSMTGLFKYYYEGYPWDVIKEYSINNYLSISHPSYFNVSTNSNIDYFASDFVGYIYIEETGVYTFYTNSDDGSSLWIGNELVVDNDGLHGASGWVSGTHEFTSPGAYPITVKFFERTGGNSLAVGWTKPGQSSIVSLPPDVLRSAPGVQPSPPGAPTNLIATASSTTNSIGLTWNYSTTPVDVVVLGSSTAYGTGGTSGNRWVELLTAGLQAQNPSNTVTNLATGGLTTADVISSGDAARNITQALSLDPDFIIVNLPSNDAAESIDLATTMANFESIKADADAANVEIYFTTSQPRDFGDVNLRQRLRTEAQSIRDAFGSHVIDIYNELATSSNFIKSKYSFGDGTHVNDAGHAYIFSEVINAIGGQTLPVFEITRSLTNGGVYSTVGQSLGRNYTDSGLNGGTRYYYRIHTVTSTGTSNSSNTANATTIGDVEAPTVPTNFVLNTKNETQVLLSWTASTDNVGVVLYEVEDLSGNASPSSKVSSTGKAAAPGSGMKWSTTSTTILINSGLEPAQNYEFTVRAYDAAGNYSPDASPTVSVTTSVPLPVEFLFVDHSITTNGVFIKWATATELNNAYFTVERGTGLDNFKALGGVDGNGTTSERHDYSFTDTNPLPLAYYRIRQTDYDGMFEYSKIIRVVYNDTDLPAFSVYPNPTTGENIHAAGYVPSTRSSVLVKMVDVMGRVHLEEEVDPNQFLNGMKINLTHPVPPGVYIIVISDGSSNTQRRVVIR